MATKSIPPTPPAIPQISFPDVEPPAPTGPRYRARDGSQNPLTTDDVTVEVISVSDRLPEGELWITCPGPSTGTVRFGAIPLAAVIRISNGTDHIIALGQTALLTGTVIVIEDEMGKSYPLHSLQSWKQELNTSIFAYYDGGFTQTFSDHQREGKEAIGRYTATLRGPYAKEYDAYKSSHGTYSLLSLLNPLWWIGAILGVDANPPLDESISPENLEARNVAQLRQEMAGIESEAHQQLAAKRSLCSQQATEAKLGEGHPVVLSGTYPPIRILPARERRIFVPLQPVGSYPKIFRFQLYDLVTRSDAAGNPTRRSTFTIDLERF
jgi:hypothetical protein